MPLDNKYNFLFIGRIIYEKGIKELFETAKIIKKKYPKVNFQLVGFFNQNNKDYVDYKYFKECIDDHLVDLKEYEWLHAIRL